MQSVRHVEIDPIGTSCFSRSLHYWRDPSSYQPYRRLAENVPHPKNLEILAPQKWGRTLCL